MQVEPLVSIVIPLYNYEKYIIDCLLSCVNQEYKNVEIIVVDDCSTDKSVEMAQKVHDSRIILLKHETNKGYSAAKNTGIRRAHGAFIRFLDADDMLTQVGISKPVEYMKAHPDIDMVHGIAYKMDGDRAYAQALRKQHKLPFDRRCKIHAQGVMVERHVFEKYGLFYEQLRSKSDKEMWERLRICGAKIGQIDSKLAFYRIHQKSMLAMRNRNKVYDNKITKMFYDRIEQIKREGLTKENTTWL